MAYNFPGDSGWVHHGPAAISLPADIVIPGEVLVGPEEGSRSTLGQGRREVSQSGKRGSPIACGQTLDAHCRRHPIA